MARFLATIPILRFFDEAVTRRFYIDYLAFEVVLEHRFGPEMPLYLGVTRGALRLHLSQHHGDATPGSAVFIEMDDVEALHAELAARSYPFARPGLETAPWAARTLTVLDPAGNRLFFNEQVRS
ncbi:glyoxalase superfamily protein [Mangrovicella endophytica]|uniref:glyoxalase superfamily protein n=1 Tax=Mangrovicella endophytica TaxID=2066697 RepID=UPI000C9EB64A|nr:glyoxalase superfamily protein [Mangrovicella endophytica]